MEEILTRPTKKQKEKRLDSWQEGFNREEELRRYRSGQEWADVDTDWRRDQRPRNVTRTSRDNDVKKAQGQNRQGKKEKKREGGTMRGGDAMHGRCHANGSPSDEREQAKREAEKRAQLRRQAQGVLSCPFLNPASCCFSTLIYSIATRLAGHTTPLIALLALHSSMTAVKGTKVQQFYCPDIDKTFANMQTLFEHLMEVCAIVNKRGRFVTWDNRHLAPQCSRLLTF